MDINKLVTAVIINYQTPDLTTIAVTTLREFYKSIPLLIIDNGSKDNSPEILKNLISLYPEISQLITNTKNMHHGPAMDQATKIVSSKYILFIDSDCEILKGNFIEKMTEQLETDSSNYLIGKLVFMNKRGFDVQPNNNSIKYIRPICMLMNVALYQTLPTFQKHGTPCLNNMRAAEKHNYSLIDFDIEKYIYHHGRGTASRFGYNLGILGKLNYLLNKLKF